MHFAKHQTLIAIGAAVACVVGIWLVVSAARCSSIATMARTPWFTRHKHVEGFDAANASSGLLTDITQMFNPLAQLVNLESGVISSDPAQARANNITVRSATDGQTVQVHDGTLNTGPVTGPVGTGAAPMTVTTKNNYLEYPAAPSVLAKVRKCEAVHMSGDATGCSALGASGSDMGECGICLKGGITHDGQPTRGGLYISASDRTAAERQMNLFNGVSQFAPSGVGQSACAPGYFFVTPPTCTDGVNQLKCAVGGAVTAGGPCGQCVDTPSEFVYLGPNPNKFDARLRLLADGTVTVSVQTPGTNVGRTVANRIAVAWDTETVIDMPGISEGDILAIVVQTTAGAHQAVVGQLEPYNTTAGSSPRTITLDTILAPPGSTVRLLGTLGSAGLPGLSAHPTIAQTAYWMWVGGPSSMSSGTPNSTLQFSATGAIPATVATPPFAIDRVRCPTGVMITTPAGQQLMNANPCLGNAQITGQLTTECLRFRWSQSGLSTSGTAYPTNVSTAALNAARTTIDAVAASYADLESVASTGIHTNGQVAARPDVVDAAMKGFGTTLSPCDGPLKNTGPQTLQCLTQLYNSSSSYAPQFAPCTATGTLNPVASDGTSANAAMAAQYNSWGGVGAIKSKLQQAQVAANTPSTPGVQGPAMLQCYGITLRNPPPAQCAASAGQVTRAAGVENVDDNITRTVSVGVDGTIWATDANQLIYRKANRKAPWEAIYGSLVQVKCANANNVVGVNSAGGIYQWNNATAKWNAIVGGATWASIGVDGTIWVVGGGGNIYKWNPVASAWNGIFGLSATQISVGDANNVWYVDITHNIFKLNSATGAFVKVPGALNYISVSMLSAGVATIIGVSQYGQLYAWNGSDWGMAPSSLHNVQASEQWPGYTTAIGNYFRSVWQDGTALTDTHCDNVGNLTNLSFTAIRQKCDATPGCNAISYFESLQGGTMRACQASSGPLSGTFYQPGCLVWGNTAATFGGPN